MNTETDTQAEDTALLMEMDEKVNKRVQECLGRILTQDDDLAEWFIRSIINHPKTTKVIREIVSKQREAEIMTAAKQDQYERYQAEQRYRLGGLANQGMAPYYSSGAAAQNVAIGVKAPLGLSDPKTPQSLLDKLRGKK